METKSDVKRWEMPNDTDWSRDCNKHEPTRSYGEEIYNYLLHLEPLGRILEIGAAWGVSSIAILQAQPSCHLTSVDSDPTVKAIAEVEKAGLNGRWRFILSRSDDFWKKNGTTFQFIYVDGSHVYRDVKNDLFKAWDVLEPGGWLMLDDFTHPKNCKAEPISGEAEYGVSLAAWELVKEKKIRHIWTSTRLLVLKKP